MHYCFHPCSADEETEAQKVKYIFQRHSAGEPRQPDSNRQADFVFVGVVGILGIVPGRREGGRK